MNNKIYIIAMTIFFIFGKSFSQEDITNMISELDWSSFNIERVNYAESTVSFAENGNKLLEKGKNITDLLLKNIGDPKKTVVIHLLLSNL